MTEIRTTSSTGGEKGVKPERYDLIPVEALASVARLYGQGAKKYAAHNWRKGYEFSKSYAAMQRHANQFWNGEDVDPEMGESHLAAVIFHALALMTMQKEHPDFDDRFASLNPSAEDLAGLREMLKPEAAKKEESLSYASVMDKHVYSSNYISGADLDVSEVRVLLTELLAASGLSEYRNEKHKYIFNGAFNNKKDVDTIRELCRTAIQRTFSKSTPPNNFEIRIGLKSDLVCYRCGKLINDGQHDRNDPSFGHPR